MSNNESLLMFALLVITFSSVTSIFHGVEDDPPPDGSPCWITGVDLPVLTPGYIQLMCTPSTKTIIFEGGVLTHFPHITKDYPNLTTISAEQCNVEDISEESFKGAHQLRFLFLSNNNIRTLRSRSFSPVTQLYKLEIQNSNLKTLKSSAFDNLAQLVHLELSDNHIKELPHGIFDSLTSLRTLVLSNNAIAQIDSKLFLHNQFLSYVYLDANDIADIESNTFATNNVQWLNLAENPRLGSLDLSWAILNKLTMLKVSNTGLQVLNIPPNADTVLADNNEIDTVVETLSVTDPKKTHKLTRLSLARNKVRNMESLFAYAQLDVLDLSDNYLESLNGDELHSMPNLRQLAVPRNPLNGAVNVKALKKRFPMLKSLLLTYGHWSDDYLIELTTELRENGITVTVDEELRAIPIPWPTNPASEAFHPKEFELYIKALHNDYTLFENKRKTLLKDYNRQSQTIKHAVDRINIMDIHMKYMQNWLYGLITVTAIAFIIMTSAYCAFSRLRQWFSDCLPSRRPQTPPLTDQDFEISGSRRALIQQ